MSASLPWSSSASPPPSNEASEVLLRIERNTASLVGWMKALVVAVVLLVVLTAVLYV